MDRDRPEETMDSTTVFLGQCPCTPPCRCLKSGQIWCHSLVAPCTHFALIMTSPENAEASPCLYTRPKCSASPKSSYWLIFRTLTDSRTIVPKQHGILCRFSFLRFHQKQPICYLSEKGGAFGMLIAARLIVQTTDLARDFE